MAGCSIADGPAVPSAWSANVWHDCVELPVASIGAAAKALRDIQRNWAMYAPLHHRRAALIQEKLPHVSAKPIVFPAAAPTAPFGSWTLLAPDRLLAAAHCSAPFPNGEVAFVEDRDGPPNRAYLKLWEALVRLRALAAARRALPRSRRLARRLDLGAGKARRRRGRGRQGAARSQGGGDARRRLARRKRLRASIPRASARSTGCSPTSSAIRRACCALVERWRASGLVKNFVCTLKFQGETDHDIGRGIRGDSRRDGPASAPQQARAHVPAAA